MKAEEALAILLGRLTFDQPSKTRIFHLIKNGIDWYDFLNICVRKKLICFAYRGLVTLGLIQLLPMIVINNMQYHYEQNRKQNNFFSKASFPIKAFLEQENILAIPTKGLRFLDTIYQEEPEVRILSDIDFIASSRNYNSINEFMIKNGFDPYLTNNQDILCSGSNEVKSRFYIKFEKEDPYGKLRADFDFSYSDKWLELIRDENHPIYEFLYLCHEFYKENINVIQISKFSSYNYVKLVDLREYYIKYVYTASLKDLLACAATAKVQESVIFTVRCMRNFFPDLFLDYKEV